MVPDLIRHFFHAIFHLSQPCVLDAASENAGQKNYYVCPIFLQ